MAKNIKDAVKQSVNYIVRKEKVAMLHPGRCGSTVLGSLMNQHQDIFWSGEPFEKQMKLDRALDLAQTKKVINEAENIRISRIYSFATKYLRDMHLSKDCINMTIEDYLNLLLDLGYTKFIVIDRSNHLRRAISMQNGRLSNQWHTKSKIGTISKIELDPIQFQIGLDYSSSLIDYFISMNTEYDVLKELLQESSTLYLNYEGDIETNPVDAYNKVCGFLDIKKYPVEVKYQKTNSFPVRDLLLNYVEIEDLLKKTPFEWMLDG